MMRAVTHGSARLDIRQTDLVHAVPVAPEAELEAVVVDDVGVNYPTSFSAQLSEEVHELAL